MDAVILAGGKGSRMEDDLPKALIPAQNQPILAYQLNYFLDKADKIILSLGHKAQEVIDFVRDEYPEFADKKILFAVEDEPLGTAGGLKHAIKLAESEYVTVLNCDDITDIDIKELEKIQHHAICVAHPRLPFGRVLEKDGYALFEEKPILDDWVSCGWYLFDRKDMLSRLPDRGSLEYEIFPNLKLKIFKHQGFWRSLNLKKDISEFELTELPECLKIPPSRKATEDK